jgi:PAS domain S-box-containing protein
VTTQSTYPSRNGHASEYPSDLDVPVRPPCTLRAPDRGFELDHFAHVEHEALAVCDASGKVMRADHATARILGGAPEDLVGRTLADVFVDDCEVVDEGLERASQPMADAAWYAVEAVGFHGERVPLLLMMRPLPGSSPRLILVALEIPLDSSPDSSAALNVSRRRAIRATTEFQKELLAQIARGEGLSGMMEMLRQHVERPVLVLDPSRTVLAEAGVRLSDRIALPRLQGALRDTRHGVVTRGSGCLSAAIAPDGRVLGWLCILDKVGDIDGRICTALEQAVSIVTFELMRIERSLEAEASSLRELADQLIGDPASDRVPSLAKALGYDLSRPHRVLAVSGGEESDDQVALTENTLRSLNLGPPLVATNRDRLFVALPDEDQPSLEVELLLSDVAQALEKALGRDIRVGVGQAYDPRQLRTSVDEAVFALDFAVSVGCSNRVTRFDQLGFWQLLVDSSSAIKLRGLVEQWIGALIRHDAMQRSDLVNTLSVYLTESCATESAAANLFIHRNTLRYRLTKIAQITGCDVSDPDQRFHLELACRARALLTMLDGIDASVPLSPAR